MDPISTNENTWFVEYYQSQAWIIDQFTTLPEDSRTADARG